MRAVGPLTQAAIDAQVFEPGLRIVILDEIGTEHALPSDAVIGWPRAEFDLDRMTWRYTLRVRMDETTAGLIYRGRDIKAWRSYAPGPDEELEEFTGYIADLKERSVWSQGVEEEAWELECLGNAARRLDSHLTRFEWKPSVINPGDGEPDDRARVTGIVKRYKLTITYSHSAVSTTLSAPPPDNTTIKVASSAGFFAGDIVWLVASGWTEGHRVTSVPDGTTLKVEGGVRQSYWPMGTVAKKGVGVVPISGPFYFPDLNLHSHIKLYDSSNVARPTSWGWGVLIDVASGALCINFTANPGATFTVDVYVMDRWVVLDRRSYNGALHVPYFYVLSGIQGQPGAERLNDRATTVLTTVGSPTVLRVADPSGIYASDSYSDRWVSVWTPDGKEYRGRVSTVDKNPASPSYGLIGLSLSIRGHDGSPPPSLPAGCEVGNTSSTHYEILDPSNRIVIFNSAGDYGANTLKAEPHGGWLFLGFKDQQVYYFIPGYEPVPSYASGSTLPAFRSLPGWPMFHVVEYPFVVPMATGSFKASENAPLNDVAEFFRQVFKAVGYTAAELDLENTGYTLAPLVRTQVTGQDLIDEVRKAILPPNYRIWEDEAGIIRGRYVRQKSVADLRIQNPQSFIPKELPKPLTRAIVKGRQIEINRAGQLFYASEGLDRVEKLFDGFQDQYANAAPMTLMVDPAGDIYAAYAAFRIPACEPGRYPNVSKVVVATGEAHISIGGGPQPKATSSTRYLPTGIKPYDATQVFERLEYTDLAPVALASGTPGESWFLVVAAEAGGGGCIDEIEVWLREGAYWEAVLTNNPALAPNDGRWHRPSKDLAISFRYVETAQLKRMLASSGKGLDRAEVIQADGITTAQAREVAEANLDHALRGSEFFEVSAPLDPRLQPTGTVEVVHQTYEDDGQGGKRKIWKSRLLTVWGVVKERKTMKLKVGDYSR